MTHGDENNLWGWISAGGTAAALLIGALAKWAWERSRALVAVRQQEMAQKQQEHDHDMAEKEAELRRTEGMFTRLADRIGRLEEERDECYRRVADQGEKMGTKIAELNVEIRILREKLGSITQSRVDTAAKQGAAQALEEATEKVVEKVADKVAEKLPPP